MKRSMLFMLLSVGLLRLAASPLQQQPPAPKARIEGIVVRAGNGEALARAKLILTRTGPPAPTAGAPRGAATPAAPTPAPQPGVAIPAGARGTSNFGPPIPPVLSDLQGRFVFPELDESSYMLQVLANGYVTLNYGQRYTNGPGIPIRLKAGQILKDLAITMVPAGNISGRIRDREDRPLVSIPVQLLRYSYDAQGQRSYQTVGSTKTDDHGDYRIYWMTPGRYYLMAGTPTNANPAMAMLAAIQGGNTDANLMPLPLSVAYFPGVPDIASAQPIDIQPGAELESINFIVSPKPPTYRIRGRIVDSRNGQPPARAIVNAVMDSNGIASNSILDQIATELPFNSYNPATGEFEVKELGAGNYSVNASAQGGDGLPAGNAPVGGRAAMPLTGTAKVTIPNADVQGVTIAVNPPTTVSGRVRSDGTLPVPPERLRFQLNSRTPTPGRPGLQNGPVVNATADGAFNFFNIAPGDYRVVLQNTAVPVAAGGRPGSTVMFIKDARYDGNDVLNGPLRISASVTSPLEIVIGIGGGQLSGMLNDRRGQSVPVSQIVLVPDRGRDRTELYRTTITDDSGRFQLSGILPGDYRVFSWEGVEPYGWFDADLMRQSENKGTVVHVTESSSDMIEVRLISKEGVQ